jgi:glycogen debranching enzyme
MPQSLEQWMADAPELVSSYDPLRHSYEQSLLDLASLRFRPLDDLRWSLPAAGLPWFMALFGRDSLITAYQALPFQPHLAQTTLEALAELQATDDDAFRDAEPGKILHELRCGELTALGERPHSPYYGSHDATALFLILLDEYEQWTGDHALLRALEPSARAALAWIESSADPDGDGYLEYRTRSSQGLANQSWKDSWNSMLFADGQLAEPPIATCEIQGYAYDARMRTARLARLVWNDNLLAERLESDAAELKRRFNRDFWSERRGHFVLALDRTKRQVDAMTSNVGHLLWSGIVDEERAESTIERLVAPDMYSGWGIRTMAATDSGYNPIEYHNGTVWPHDTSIVAEGLRRYGARAAATRLAFNVIEAADAFDYQLPEVFAGFPRHDTVIPVEFPTSCKPQAWAAGAVLLALRTFLGLDPDGSKLTGSPYLPDEITSLGLARVPFRTARVDVP